MTALRRSLGKPWLWAYVAAIAVWLATIVITGGQAAGELLTAALTFASFFVLVAIGQMFVITLGPGQRRPLDPGHDGARRRRLHEDHGRRATR